MEGRNKNQKRKWEKRKPKPRVVEDSLEEDELDMDDSSYEEEWRKQHLEAASKEKCKLNELAQEPTR